MICGEFFPPSRVGVVGFFLGTYFFFLGGKFFFFLRKA